MEHFNKSVAVAGSPVLPLLSEAKQDSLPKQTFAMATSKRREFAIGAATKTFKGTLFITLPTVPSIFFSFLPLNKRHVEDSIDWAYFGSASNSK